MSEFPVKPADDPDLDVVRRICAGERHLFELLMRRHNQRVFRTARAIVGSDVEAEDVMQNAYLRAFSALAGFEGRARFSTWLVRITLHEALAHKRQRQDSPERDVEHLMDDALGPPERASSTEVQGLLEEAIARLAEPFRVVFVLRAVEQLSVREVAECLDLDEATVKTRYFRARARLQARLVQRAEAIAPDLFDFRRQRCDRVVARVLSLLPDRSES